MPSGSGVEIMSLQLVQVVPESQTCTLAPPPLAIAAQTANAISSVVPSVETAPQPQLAPSPGPDSFDPCPVCQLLLVDGVICHHCSYQGHSNPPPSDTDTEDDQPMISKIPYLQIVFSIALPRRKSSSSPSLMTHQMRSDLASLLRTI